MSEVTNAELEEQYRNLWNTYYNQRKAKGTEGQDGSRTSFEKQHRHTSSLDTRRWAMGRESQVLLSGSSNWYDSFMQFWVNPSECSWQVGIRSAIEKTSGGAVRHEIQQLERSPLSGFTRLD